MSTAAPVIGLSAYEEQVRWGVWDVPGVLLPSTYVRAVVAAGGVPVLVPPVPDAAVVVPRLDGLVLSGGPDIDPDRYGAAPAEATGAPRVARDTAELALLAAATTAGVPVLGICRGLQLLNVARRGTLHQHLPDVVGSAGHAPGAGTYGRHPVAVDERSLLARVLGRTSAEVPSYHHQAVDALGAGLTVTATAPDGTVEAVEDPSLPFCLAVQWHPEAGDDLSLFRALVGAAQDRAARG